MLEFWAEVGAVLTPLLILGLTALGWKFRSRIERRFALDDTLRVDRIAIYNRILEPFMIIFMSDAAWQSDPKLKKLDKFQMATQKLLSLGYRQEGFRMSLIGSDEVVLAYNNLMQYFFQRGGDAPTPSKSDVKEMMQLIAVLLLEIRKSVGNEFTKLEPWDMIEWFMSDARQFRE